MSALRAKWLRWRIARNRCTERPGIAHHWEHWEGPDFTSHGGWLEGIQCVKCRRAK